MVDVNTDHLAEAMFYRSLLLHSVFFGKKLLGKDQYKEWEVILHLLEGKTCT